MWMYLCIGKHIYLFRLYNRKHLYSVCKYTADPSTTYLYHGPSFMNTPNERSSEQVNVVCPKPETIINMLLKAVLVCVLVAVLHHLAKFIYILEFHKAVYNHAPGPCKIIPGIEHGSEDIETLPSGLTFISSGWTVPPILSEGQKKYRKDNDVKGRIFIFDFNRQQDGVKELEIFNFPDLSDFHPHGISVYQNSQTGTITLFVVNHGRKQDSIEKFQYLLKEKVLRHIRSYTSDTMSICNDVTAVNEDSFYFSNSVYYRAHPWIIMEFILMLSYGSVGYFDGDQYSIVLDRLYSPNGLILSANQKYLYLLVGGGINIYSRGNGGQLQLVNKRPLYTYVDNPAIMSETGNILLGAHPVFHKLFGHIENPDVPAPSQVLMLHMKDEYNVTDVTELYSDEGQTLYGSSVATIWKNKMLIGTVQHKLMLCDVKTL